MNMIATLPKHPVSNARQLDKQLASAYTLVAYDGGFKEIVRVKIWATKTGSRYYAAIWVQGDDSNNRPWVSGAGSAGGWGYHKASAALSEALDSAEIKLFRSQEQIDYTKAADISGRGETVLQEAIYAIGRACGYSQDKLHLVTI